MTKFKTVEKWSYWFLAACSIFVCAVDLYSRNFNDAFIVMILFWVVTIARKIETK